VTPIGNSDALAEAIIHILKDPDAFIRPRSEIAARFSTERTAEAYEQLFTELRK
jgi:hypothetical protein